MGTPGAAGAVTGTPVAPATGPGAAAAAPGTGVGGAPGAGGVPSPGVAP